jgi:hypothetical protein
MKKKKRKITVALKKHIKKYTSKNYETNFLNRKYLITWKNE